MINLIKGDCLEEMDKLIAQGVKVDSIITDPPYGISFMGKKWDYDVPQVEVWKECLRVLKPGGHALVACGTRTQHRMAVNLEDAGFEIRDIVAWVYGSGFPKSHNIGKAVDKIQGNEREVIGKNPNYRINNGQNEFQENGTFNTTEGMKMKTKGSSKYEGWGTALKPAMELWTLCRKPLEKKTVAKNTLKYGTGGINIDKCRVPSKQGEYDVRHYTKEDCFQNKEPKKSKFQVKPQPIGRFPANLIHDGSEEVVSKFPDTKTGGSGKLGTFRKAQSPIEFTSERTVTNKEYREPFEGSASRFFYCAKASKSERNKGTEELELGNNHATVKPVKLMRYLCRLITPKGGTILDCFCGSGSTGIGAKLEGFDFIGIEKEEEYFEIAKTRINNTPQKLNI